MKINKNWNVVVLSIAIFLLAACSNNEGGTVAATELPQDCESFFRAMSVCNANGEKASAEEAEKKYAELVQSYKDGAGGLTAESCKTAVDTLKAFQKTGC